MRSWLSSWEVEVGSRLALTSTQLNGSLVVMVDPALENISLMPGSSASLELHV